MTAKRLPSVADNSCTAFRANGKVWMVQTIIFLPSFNACDSWVLLLPFSSLTVATTPCRALEVEDRFLQLGIEHIAVGNDQDAVE